MFLENSLSTLLRTDYKPTINETIISLARTDYKGDISAIKVLTDEDLRNRKSVRFVPNRMCKYN